MVDDKFYYTWNLGVGNLVDGTLKIKPKFKLDDGEMSVCLHLAKNGAGRPHIGINFYLTTGKMAYVNFTWSVSSNGNVLWQKERSEELEVKSNSKNGFTGGHIIDDLPSDLSPNLLVTVEINYWSLSKWQPHRE